MTREDLRSVQTSQGSHRRPTRPIPSGMLEDVRDVSDRDKRPVVLLATLVRELVDREQRAVAEAVRAKGSLFAGRGDRM